VELRLHEISISALGGYECPAHPPHDLFPGKVPRQLIDGQ